MKIEFIASQSVTEAPEALAVLASRRRARRRRRRRWMTPPAARFAAPSPPRASRARRARRWTCWRPRASRRAARCSSARERRPSFDAAGAEGSPRQAYQALKLSGAHTVWLHAARRGGRHGGAGGVRGSPGRLPLRPLPDQGTADDKKPSIKRVRRRLRRSQGGQEGFAGPLGGVAEAVEFTRDLVSEPANILYPEEFAQRVKKLEKLGLEVEILGEKEMKKLGMGSLLGVGQG